MKILDIYSEYRIMPNLAMHQLRVAAVALMICESLDLEVDKESIVKACLLHDIGNIIKFNLNYFPEWNEPQGLEYWEGVKNDYVLKYGNDEHKASLLIAKELKVTSIIYNLIDCIDSSVAERIVNENNFEKKICAYVDNRVTPYGVVSAEEHSLNAKERYKNHPHAFSEENRILFMKNLFEIEKQIFSHSKIVPEDINDNSMEKYLEKVKSIEI